MDSDRHLKTEFRQALDDVLPPAPWLEAAVTEDLRRRRWNQSVDRGIGKARETRPALPRPPLRLAAALLVVLLAATATVTFIELRYQAQQSRPASPLSVKSYQQMIDRDWAAFPPGDDSCSTLQSVCPRPGHPYLTALQRWSDDLKTSEPPTRFAVIDAQLRLHLAANIQELKALFAAYQAKDQAGFDRAWAMGNSENAWIFDVAGSIVGSAQDNASLYAVEVRLADQSYLGCLSCQALVSVTHTDCADIRNASCMNYVANAIATVGGFESTLVRAAAPESLVRQDAALQRDLALADTGTLEMSNAQLTGDPAGFGAGLTLLQRALPAISADIAHITPPGSPVPAQLLGDWLMPAAAADSLAGGACPSPLAVATCMFRLTLTTTTYNWTVNVPGYSDGGGDIVANGAELDFFNGQECGAYLPTGIGRYSWSLTGGVLHFVPLNQDLCPRAPFLANQSYSRSG